MVLVLHTTIHCWFAGKGQLIDAPPALSPNSVGNESFVVITFANNGFIICLTGQPGLGKNSCANDGETVVAHVQASHGMQGCNCCELYGFFFVALTDGCHCDEELVYRDKNIFYRPCGPNLFLGCSVCCIAVLDFSIDCMALELQSLAWYKGWGMSQKLLYWLTGMISKQDLGISFVSLFAAGIFSQVLLNGWFLLSFLHHTVSFLHHTV